MDSERNGAINSTAFYRGIHRSQSLNECATLFHGLGHLSHVNHMVCTQLLCEGQSMWRDIYMESIDVMQRCTWALCKPCERAAVLITRRTGDSYLGLE